MVSMVSARHMGFKTVAMFCAVALAVSLCSPFGASCAFAAQSIGPSVEIDGSMPSVENGDKPYDLDSTGIIRGACGGGNSDSTEFLDVIGVDNIGTTGGYNWGTKINVAANAFAWNANLGAYSLANLGDSEASDRQAGEGSARSGWSTVLSYASVKKYRPDVLVASQKNALETYLTIVQMIQEDDGLDPADEGYYNPVVVNGMTNQGIGLTTMSDLLWIEAAAVKSSKGYDAGKKTRYGDPAEIAQAYEEMVKGLQWYILSQVEGADKMKTVAYVNKYENGQITALVTDPSEEHDFSGTTGSRPLEAFEQITHNVVETSSKWTQVSPVGTGGTGTYVTTDLSALADADVIFLSTAQGGNSGVNPDSTDSTNLASSELGQALAAAGYDGIPIVAPNVATTGHGFNMSKNLLEMIGYLYPDYFKLSYGLKYFYSTFGHIKNECIDAVMVDQDSKLLMPNGAGLDTTGYSEDYITSRVLAGERYYLGNYENPKSNCSHFRLRATGTVDANAYTFTASAEGVDPTGSVGVADEPVVADKPRQSIDQAVISGLREAYAYTGKAIVPSVRVSLNGKELVSGRDFEVSCANSKKIGKATLTVTGMGSYEGTLEAAFNVKPATGVIVQAKRVGVANLKLTAKAQSGATKYQFRVTYAKANGKSVTKKVASSSNTAKISGVLKAVKATKATVSVRVYSKKLGVWGGWSSKKSVSV